MTAGPNTAFDVAIVGMGIVGLAHAYWAARAGRRVVVFDRDAKASGASIRNFGFVTVTGQAPGDMWSLARRSRDIWASIAPALSTPIQHYGLAVVAQRPDALPVLDAFKDTQMGTDCDIMTIGQLKQRHPGLPFDDRLTALVSPYELRFDAPQAIPAVTQYLEKEWDVCFRPKTSVLSIDGHIIGTSQGDIRADHIIICPGADFTGLFAEQIADRHVKKCKLHMLRLADPGFRLPFAIQSDLSLVRYEGYATLPQAEQLMTTLKKEQPDHLENGIHLIVVQNADGSLVVGDSHHYADAPTPFYDSRVEALILQEFEALFQMAPPPVLERWTGIYPYASTPYFVDSPTPQSRLVLVTCGAGMSTAFGIAEKTVNNLLGTDT